MIEKNEVLKNYNDIKSSLSKLPVSLGDYEKEKISEHMVCTNTQNSYEDIINWANTKTKQFNTSLEEVPLGSLNKWKIENDKISHDSGKFFEILGLRIGSDPSREVSTGWDQPIVKEYNFDGGILGLLRTYIDDLPHYLVQAQFEPGNYGPIQISPTLQATFSNINQEHGGRKPHYHQFFSDFEKNTSDYKFNAWLSEDGGKFYKKRNRGLVKQVKSENIQIIDDNFKWVSLRQIKKMLELNSLINPHLARLIFL